METDDRTSRLDAYKTVLGIIEQVGASKLHAPEATAIKWAAEGLLLASGPEDTEVAESQLAFSTLMDDLESHRWQDMLGDDSSPGTARKLREAFAGCGPQPVLSGA